MQSARSRPDPQFSESVSNKITPHPQLPPPIAAASVSAFVLGEACLARKWALNFMGAFATGQGHAGCASSGQRAQPHCRDLEQTRVSTAWDSDAGTPHLSPALLHLAKVNRGRTGFKKCLNPVLFLQTIFLTVSPRAVC